MFGWGESVCPCDDAAKDWIERRLAWISRQFPSTIFTDRPLVLPTEEFFPEKHEPTRECAKALLVQVCTYMGMSADHCILKFTSEARKIYPMNEDRDSLPFAAGTYGHSHRHVIVVDNGQLYHPADLICTMASDLAHARLHGEGGVHRPRHDEELLTDLTAFALGFAVFMANASPPVSMSSSSPWPGTKLPMPRHMTSPMYGYALGHVAWFKAQRKPPWMKFLGPNVINVFKDATRFLFDTGNTTFKPARRWGPTRLR